jgi:hypothetical protein
VSDTRWGILGAAKFAREFMGTALTLAPGGQLVALATDAAAGVLVAEAFMIVFHPQWQRVRELLEAGSIGLLWRIDAAFPYNNRDPAKYPKPGRRWWRRAARHRRLCDRRRALCHRAGTHRDAGADPLGRRRGCLCGAVGAVRRGPLQRLYLDAHARPPGDHLPRRRGVLHLPVPFNPRSFGQAQLEWRRGLETTTQRWPSANRYELQVAAFNRSVRKRVPYPCTLAFSRGRRWGWMRLWRVLVRGERRFPTPTRAHATGRATVTDAASETMPGRGEHLTASESRFLPS